MAINVVSLIMDYLTPDMVGRIASSLGLDRGSAQKAIGASVPSLLAGITGLAQKPDGARQLSNALTQQPPGILDSLGSMIGGPEQTGLAENGSSMLSKLFGGGVLGGLTSAVGKFAGISDGTSRSLLGMLGPLVLGGLAQHQRSAGLDAGGLLNFLGSQKDNIAAAIPLGFSKLLGGSDLLDSISGNLRSGASAASAAAGRVGVMSDQAASAAGRAAHEATRKTSTDWLPWAAGLAVLAGLVWYFMGNQDAQRVAQQSRTTATETIQPAQNLTVGGIDLAGQVNSAVGGLQTALRRIMDPTSAQEVLPQLQEAAAKLDSVTGLAAQLPADGKKALAAKVAADIPALNQSFNNVLAKPEVAAVVQPEIEGLRTKLNALANG